MTPRAAVFCFHDVLPDGERAAVPAGHRPYVLAPEELRALLMAAATLGRRTVPAGDVPRELAGGFFALTFDDGAASDYTEVFPILCELGMRATFFVVPTLVGTTGHVSWGQLREMVASGMEVGSHSLTHPFMHDLDEAGVRREFGESKAAIEDRLGCAVRSGSLPRGWEPPRYAEVLRELGYRVFCTSRVDWWRPGGPALAMPRIAVRRGLEPETFAALAAGDARALWRLQGVDRLKRVAKRCLGLRRWQTVREPLLALWERVAWR